MTREPFDLTPYIVPGSARVEPEHTRNPGSVTDWVREAIEAGLSHERDVEAMHRAMTATPLEVKGLREAIAAIAAAPPEPDPMHAMMTEHLDQLAAAFDPGGVYACPVAGCGWRLRVEAPVLESEFGVYGLSDGVLRYTGARRTDVDAYLARHAEAHAATSETGLDPAEHERHDAP